MAELRRCNQCGVPKPLVEFAKGRTYKDGRRSTCKSCVNRRQNARVSGWRGPSARLPGSVSRSIGL